MPNLRDYTEESLAETLRLHEEKVVPGHALLCEQPFILAVAIFYVHLNERTKL